MTLKTIVQDAARQIGLPVPLTVIDNADENVARLLRFANQEGIELVRKHNWQALQRERTFSALAAETQTSAVPSDYSHFINGTFYNRTRKREVVGPLTAQEWQEQKSLTSTVVIDAFRQRGSSILIIPNPAASDAMVFEYMSKHWVDTDDDGLGDAAKFAADTDAPVYDEELMTMGVVWRYRQSRAFDYGEDFRTYEAMLARIKGDDGGKRTMSLASGEGRVRGLSVPEGSWTV